MVKVGNPVLLCDYGVKTSGTIWKGFGPKPGFAFVISELNKEFKLV